MNPRTIMLGTLLGLPLQGAVEAPLRLPTSAHAPERIVANANRRPAGHLRNGVLTLQLEVRTGVLRPQADDGPGIEVQAFAEAGGPLQVPGPLVRVPAGTVIHASVRNTLSDSTLVLHGLQTRPGAATDTVQVAPRSTREVRFTAGAPGTYYYWGTTTAREMEDSRWIDSQLSGAFVVDSAGAPAHPADRVFVIGVWLKPADSLAGEPERELMVINGRSWPETERLEYTQGDTVRWRWVNPSASSHPMHLHGFYFDVLSRGAWAADTVYHVAERRSVVTELMPPGGTMTLRWVPVRPGNWVFHCHFAFHVSDALYLAPHHSAADPMRHRMAGLVLGLHVRPRPTVTYAAARPAGEARPYRLVVRPLPAPADSAHVMGYALETENGANAASIPGPLLLLERDRPARITVVNRLAEPTAVHWHGLEVESFPDGVPGWSGTPGRLFPGIAPGDSFTAELTPPRAGSFMYHAHADELVQIMGGLYGPLIVTAPGETFDTSANRIVMIGGLFRNDSAFGVVNGRLDPAPIEMVTGRTYRIRLFNIGDARTWFSLRRRDSTAAGWRIVAKDGADLPTSQARTLIEPFLTGPGEIADFEFTPAAAGDLTLALDSPFAVWHLNVPVEVRSR
ncbi:MAG TPA: multicopper oxidase domain-containing protein [Gemmatimonadales bacterium]